MTKIRPLEDVYSKNCMKDRSKNYKQNTESDTVKNDSTFSYQYGLKD